MEQPLFHIGDIIQKLRELRELSIVELADKAGLDKATISKVERTGTGFKGETLEKIAEALGVVPEYIRAHVERVKGSPRQLKPIEAVFPYATNEEISLLQATEHLLNRIGKHNAPALKYFVKGLECFLDAIPKGDHWRRI